MEKISDVFKCLWEGAIREEEAEYAKEEDPPPPAKGPGGEKPRSDGMQYRKGPVSEVGREAAPLGEEMPREAEDALGGFRGRK